MARAAVLGRLTWQAASVAAVRRETETAVTLSLDVPDWSGHRAGQHVDLRLTAEDGYSTQRSYSIASPAQSEAVELTVQAVPDGEVSTYLAGVVATGDQVEIRGPIGGWFVWDPEDTAAVRLFAGGSGIVPLMSMIRTRRVAGRTAPFHLVYSVRTPRDAIYAGELRDLAETDPQLTVDVTYTREAPQGWQRPPGRLNREEIRAVAADTGSGAATFVCGPTAFVEYVADALVSLGYDPGRIRTERFGPQGGKG